MTPRLSLVGLLLGSAAAWNPSVHGPLGLRKLMPLRAAGDAVTGAKFEENDETKNPDKRPGHEVAGMAEIDEETAARQNRIREHQQGCQRPTWAEEIRTLMSQPAGFATLATINTKGKVAGFPLGSTVGFAVDEAGFPIFCFSGMSGHTKNVLADPRASLCVTEPGFVGAADARTTFVGTMEVLDGDAADEARAAYLQSHPGAYWAQFGDFKMFRLTDIKEISFIGGFARAGGISWDDYTAAEVDPLASFAGPVMAHMNDDHSDSLKQYLQWLVGVDTSTVDAAEMKRLDKYGFDVRVTQQGGSGVLRVPFPEPVTERGAVKSAIVALSKECARLEAESEAK